MILGALVKRKK